MRARARGRFGDTASGWRGGARPRGPGSSAEGDREGRRGGATPPRPFAGRAWARCPPAQCCPSSGDSLASTGPFGRRRWVSGGGQQVELRKPRTVPVCPSSCQSLSACFVTGSWPSGHSRTGPKGQSAAGRKSESHRAACVLGPGPPGAHGLLSGRPDPWLSSRWTWTRTRPSGSTTACWSWKRRSRPPCGAQTRRADGTDCPVRSGPWLHAVAAPPLPGPSQPARAQEKGAESTPASCSPGWRRVLTVGTPSRPSAGAGLPLEPPRFADRVWAE